MYVWGGADGAASRSSVRDKEPWGGLDAGRSEGGRTAFVLSAEGFFNLNTTSFQRTDGLDRTRSFIGISTPVAKAINAEVGYLNQHVFVRD